MKERYIESVHGSGGRRARDLIQRVFTNRFGESSAHENDVGEVAHNGGRLVTTTDGFVVTPRVFPGGNIGSLAIHGTVNDLAAGGARPLALTVSYIIEEGLPLEELELFAESMADAAREVGVTIVAGDTKVVAKGACDGCFITTTGIGEVLPGYQCDPASIQPGDMVLVSGPIGDHGLALLMERTGLSGGVTSDSAPVARLVTECAKELAPSIRCMRDPTRGGLAAVLNELADASKVGFCLNEADIPVRDGVVSACELLGVEAWQSACEGRLVAVCDPLRAQELKDFWRSLPEGAGAEIIGTAIEDNDCYVELKGSYGSSRLLDWPNGEQFPRIC